MIKIPRKFILQFVGLILIAVGLFAAIIAPLEFSLFKDITGELQGFGYLGFAIQSG